MKPWQEIMSLKSTKGLILIVVGLLFLGLPLFASQYVSYLMLTFFAYAIMVLGLNLLFGYTGLLSFGHAFLFLFIKILLFNRRRRRDAGLETLSSGVQPFRNPQNEIPHRKLLFLLPCSFRAAYLRYVENRFLPVWTLPEGDQ